jgi:hypothetical protein
VGAVIDTSVYIGHWEHGQYEEALDRQAPGFPERRADRSDRTRARATVVTANRDDFSLLGRKLGVRVLVL